MFIKKKILSYLCGWIQVDRLSITLRNISGNNNPIKQFIKFSFVGCLGISINYGTFYLLYKAFSVYYISSSLIGYILAGIVIFNLNRQWTFRVKHGDIKKQYLKYFSLISFTFILNGVSIFFLTEVLHFVPEISQVITMGITICANFLGTKLWVFKK